MPYVAFIKDSVSKCNEVFNTMLSSCFSDPNRVESGTTGSYTYNIVEVDEETGRRSFYYRLRRYNYSEAQGKFIVGTLNIGSSIGKLIDMRKGLSTEEAQSILRDVGRNIIRLKKPDLLRSIKEEFDKVFYLYQNFLIWAWFPLCK